MKGRRRSPRPAPRRLRGLWAVLLLLTLVLSGLREWVWLSPETGEFQAVDGDSLRKGEQEYRLHAIDAPELHQTCQSAAGRDYACGRESREALRGLVRGRSLQCRVLETDRYGRLVAECSAGELSINGEMVRSGWALAYRRHGNQHAGAESQARQARRGIWQGRFEMPERWRERHRRQPLRAGPEGEEAAFD